MAGETFQRWSSDPLRHFDPVSQGLTTATRYLQDAVAAGDAQSALAIYNSVLPSLAAIGESTVQATAPVEYGQFILTWQQVSAWIQGQAGTLPTDPVTGNVQLSQPLAPGTITPVTADQGAAYTAAATTVTVQGQETVQNIDEAIASLSPQAREVYNHYLSVMGYSKEWALVQAINYETKLAAGGAVGPPPSSVIGDQTQVAGTLPPAPSSKVGLGPSQLARPEVVTEGPDMVTGGGVAAGAEPADLTTARAFPPWLLPVAALAVLAFLFFRRGR